MVARQQKLLGEEVGRLVLRDLAIVHQNTRELRNETTMTPAEKANLVNSLTDPAEVAAYNDFRYFHEFLSRAAISFNVQQQSAEARFWQIFCVLDNLRLAERENVHILTLLPRIMTKSQFERTRSLFGSSGEKDFGRGAAVVEVSGYPEGTYKTDRQGRFQYPSPVWRRPYLAENVLTHKTMMALTLGAYEAAIRESLVIKAAVEITGLFLEVPELSRLVGEVDLEPVANLNLIMAEIPGLICRRDLFPGERPEEELRAELAELLRPLDVKKLKPTAKARARAKRAMDFSVARGNAEKIYKILRLEERE